jgi:hypothetical protein
VIVNLKRVAETFSLEGSSCDVEVYDLGWSFPPKCDRLSMARHTWTPSLRNDIDFHNIVDVHRKVGKGQ